MRTGKKPGRKNDREKPQGRKNTEKRWEFKKRSTQWTGKIKTEVTQVKTQTGLNREQ